MVSSTCVGARSVAPSAAQLCKSPARGEGDKSSPLPISRPPPPSLFLSLQTAGLGDDASTTGPAQPSTAVLHNGSTPHWPPFAMTLTYSVLSASTCHILCQIIRVVHYGAAPGIAAVPSPLVDDSDGRDKTRQWRTAGHDDHDHDRRLSGSPSSKANNTRLHTLRTYMYVHCVCVTDDGRSPGPRSRFNARFPLPQSALVDDDQPQTSCTGALCS